MTFGAAPDDTVALDPVPRILTEPEWSELQAGIGQRLLAMEAFVADVYGEGRVFEADVLTREEVEASPHYEPAMRGVAPRRWISFTGLDVVRCEDGRFRVIEDQARMPSGIAYAVAMRETLRDVAGCRAAAARTYRSSSASWRSRFGTPPRLAWTSRAWCSSRRGPSAAGWWEHERLARELCAPVVTLGDLEQRDGRVVAWVDGRPRGVDVVYLRTAEDRFTGMDGSPTADRGGAAGAGRRRDGRCRERTRLRRRRRQARARARGRADPLLPRPGAAAAVDPVAGRRPR